MNLLLGSQSPRRQQLLSALHIPFTVVKIECEEHFPPDMQRDAIPMYLATQKALAYHERLQPDDVLLTADTIVWVERFKTMLGKPKNTKQAKEMLKMLSGRTHQVYTGVRLTALKKNATFSCKTDVTFRKLTDNEIDYYIDHFQPFDKAGAYGIQEWIGVTACTSVKGSYFNVMGLPTHEVATHLKKFV